MYVKSLTEIQRVTVDPSKPVRLTTILPDGTEQVLSRHENVGVLVISQEELITQTEFEAEQKKIELQKQLAALEAQK